MAGGGGPVKEEVEEKQRELVGLAKLKGIYDQLS